MLKQILFICLLNIAISQEELVEIGLSAEYEQLMEQINNDAYGSTLLLQIQTEVEKKNPKETDQMNQIIQYLYELERLTVQDQQNDQESIQVELDTAHEQLKELKLRIQETKYDISSIGGLLGSLRDQFIRFEARTNEKQAILDEYQDAKCKLAEIRAAEKKQFETNRDQQTNTAQLIKRARYLIKELLPKSLVLAQQSREMTTDDIQLQFQYLKQDMKEQLDENYLSLLNTFVQLDTSAPVDTKKVNAILQVLQTLYDEVDKTSRVQYKAEDDREDLYKRILQQIASDTQLLQEQLANIDSDAQNKHTSSKDLEVDQRNKEQLLSSIVNQYKDLKKQKEDSKVYIDTIEVAYNQRLSARKNQLNLIRQARLVIESNFSAASKYIQKLKSKDQKK